MVTVRTVRAERLARQREAAAISEGQWLAEFRRQGGDMAFQWHLAGQRIRIVFAHVSRPIMRPLLRFLGAL